MSAALFVKRLGFSFAVATALSVPALAQSSSAATLASKHIVCAPNADVSNSGCGNTGIGNSGIANNGTGNSGALNNGSANSGDTNIGVGNSGSGNIGTGNSGCGNKGVANSGEGNTGVALSGGSSECTRTPVTQPKPPPTTTPTTPTTTTEHESSTTVGTAEPVIAVEAATLAATGRDSAAPLTLAFALLLTGALAVGLANRRRYAVAAANGGNLLPLSAAVGLLLTGRANRAETGETDEKARS